MMVDSQMLDYMTRNEADMAFKRRVHTIFEWIKPTEDKRILDCACGRGFYLNMFRYVSDCALVGLELEWDVINMARRSVGNLSDLMLTNASIDHLPYADDSFDGVILSEILEHIEDDVGGLREVYRVLKRGGTVAITVPNANYPFWWDPLNRTLETILGTHIHAGPLAGIWANHVRLYDSEQLHDAVRSAGFYVEEERSFTHYCFPFIHNFVYGLGKPLLESGWLPEAMADAVDRTAFNKSNGSVLNPMNVGLKVLNFFDRKNVMSEPAGLSTVNLCVKARKAE